jgi:hypothetical protein
VAGIVALCSDPTDAAENWRGVKQAHLETLQNAPAQVRRVALAEKLDNARSIVRNLREVGSEVWPKMEIEPVDLLWYFDELVDLFVRDHPGAMASELTRQVENLHILADRDRQPGVG